MSVKVGVRVRPFNQRQIDLNCRLCIDMMGPTTRLFDADDPQKHRDFTFDYSFWSHDCFHADDRGYFVCDTQKYADQMHVFEQVGLEILANAWEGYHCCLFAYGQTGAGKSYSMVGYGANKGIVPISCEQIFKRIANNEDPNKEYQVNVSMLQIYNEKVQDLLIPINKRTKEGFKIRQHKTLGIYVEGLSKHYVDTYEAIEQKMNDGSKNRSIAATEMNASSSRAHTIISVQFRQKELYQGKKREKLSVIHLVDLAGSQKVGKTGATGDRLKEAAGINKSLSVLGLVISTLADKALGKGKGIVVPYRDSCLTRILQNALGGNSKTLMICAISPATDNYEQTLSTLRYADQAKKIQNKAVVNQSETDKIIRNLTAEKDQLRDKLSKFQEMFKKISQGLGIDAQKMQQFNETQEQLKFNTMMMNDYSMTKNEKLENEKQTDKLLSDSKVNINQPHISNLNEDPQLSRRINYSINKEKITIGRRNNDPQNDIQIGGMGIRSIHATIQRNQQNKLFIQPISQSENSSCYLNGNHILEKMEIMNLDRLIFGTNNFFIVIIPDSQPREQIEEQKVDWEYAQNQIYLAKEQIQKEQNEEKQKKIKEENLQILKKKEQELAQLQKKLAENEEMRKNLQAQKQIQKIQMEKKLREEEAEKLREEIEKNKKQIKNSENQRLKEKYYFEKKLLKSLPKCIELDLIAKELKRNISMSVKILTQNQEDDDEVQIKKRSVKIKVSNHEEGYSYWWDTEKLSNRYYIIKDMVDTYFQSGIIPELDKKDDPFWDQPEPTLIGRSFIPLNTLAYVFDNPTTIPLIGENDQCGQLFVNLIPTDESGTKNLSQELDEEEQECEPEDLVGQPFHFRLQIGEGIIPDNFFRTFVQYNVKTKPNKKQSFNTEEIEEQTKSPNYHYQQLHTFAKLNQTLLDYLLKGKIIFKVYGVEKIPIIKNVQPTEQEKKKKQEKKTKKKNGQSSSKKSKNSEKKEEKQQKQVKETIKNSQGEICDQTRAKKQSENIKIKKKEKDEDCCIF